MKKFILVTAVLLLTGFTSLYAQNFPIQPIPSYGCPLVTERTGFQEIMTHATPGREKREMDVVISSSSTHPQMVSAKVWVIKDNGTIVKGPYRIYLDQLLSVPIDNGKWNVVIKCKFSNINACVWID
jgi:hypothetical protein